jgi:hypothetical protein
MARKRFAITYINQANHKLQRILKASARRTSALYTER